jgi:hypothetical protein
MHQIGSRKDHRFDSDGQIKASRGRASNEDTALINDQIETSNKDFFDCLACGRYEQLACPSDCKRTK